MLELSIKIFLLIVRSKLLWLLIPFSVLFAILLPLPRIDELVLLIIQLLGILLGGLVTALAIVAGVLTQSSFVLEVVKSEENESRIYIKFLESLKMDFFIVLTSFLLCMVVYSFMFIDIPYIANPIPALPKGRTCLFLVMFFFLLSISALKDVIFSLFAIICVFKEVIKRSLRS